MKNSLAAIFLILSCINTCAWAATKPNIVIIYADDIGYGDIGVYGGTGVDTPAIDKLARQGLRFTSAYATASTCTPSRYSLLTGQYAFRNKDAIILAGNAPLIIDPKKPTMASMLRDAGYATALVGKWHLGLGDPSQPLDWNGRIAPGPKEVGFDYSFHMAATGDRVPSVYIENGHIVNLDKSDPVRVSYKKKIGSEPTGISHSEQLRIQADTQHSGTIVNGISRIGTMVGGKAARWTDEDMPDVFLNKALQFIEKKRNTPFFLFYATHENHVPRAPHPRFVGSSSLGLRGDAIAQFDWSVGKVIAKLTELKLATNTLVILSSDNGPVLFDGYWDGAVEKNGAHRPAGPFSGGKYSVNEGGTRMPFIVSWPGRVSPGISDALISQADLITSIAPLVGGKLNNSKTLDGQNLIATLLGDSFQGRDALIQQGVNSKAIRKGDWKYIPPGSITNRGKIGKFNRTKVAEPGLLYFLPEDPQERNNLAARYPQIVKSLRKELQKRVGGSSATKSTAKQLGFE